MSTDALARSSEEGADPHPAGAWPSFRRVTELVARSLSIAPEALLESFRPATERHLDEVVALRRAVFGDSMAADDARYLAWRYHFGSDRRGRGDCWVLLLGGKVIGMVGTETVELRRTEGGEPAWSTMDIAVHPAYEGAGLGAWMNLRVCALAGCALTIGSNPRSRGMLTRSFRRLPDRRTYVHLLRSERALAKQIRPRLLARAVAPFADAAGRTWRALMLAGAPAGIELRPILRFDASVEPLIDRAARPRELSIGRSRAFLNWRLFDNPRASYEVTGAYRGERLVGFLATQSALRADRSPTLVLVDWLIEVDGFDVILRALCGQALRRAEGEGAETVGVTAYHLPSERLFRRWGFIPRPNPYETMAILSTDSARLERLLEPAEWFVTEANTDRDGLGG